MSEFIHINPAAKNWAFDPPASRSSPDVVLAFHRGLPDYNQTRLHSLPGLAASLGVSHVLLKDESDRFGLPAFKILGASWSVYRAVARHLGLEPDGSSLKEVASAAEEVGDVSVVTSTEGNCGRAVARMARLLGVRCKVFVPAYMDEATRSKIRGEGAEVVEVKGSYDATIPAIREEVEARGKGAIMILDVGLDGFEEVPRGFVEGYGTMLAESDRQVGEVTGGRAATHAFVPCGAGSIAEAVTEHYKRSRRETKGCVVAVEPVSAACLKASLEAGRSVSVETGDSIMNGMNCGILSSLAWPVLREGVDVSVVVTETEAHDAVEELKTLGVLAGPCGAAGVAALRRVASDASAADAAGLGPESVVVLYCTEGARDYVVPT